MKRTWLEEIVTALHHLDGTASYAELYEEIKKARETQLPTAWQEIVRRTIQKNSSDSRAFFSNSRGLDIFFAVEGIGNGIWGLRELLETPMRSTEIPPDSTTSELIESSENDQTVRVRASGNPSPSRVLIETYRVLRDTELARQIKLLHRSCCQVCGHTIEIPGGKRYAEAHHVIPLGGVHRGPDTASNILILCPNHHAEMDMGLMKLDQKALRHVKGHTLSEKSIHYHNQRIFRKR